MDIKEIKVIESALKRARKSLKKSNIGEFRDNSMSYCDSYVWDLVKLDRFLPSYLDSLDVQNVDPARTKKSSELFSLPRGITIPRELKLRYVTNRAEYSQLFLSLICEENKRILVRDSVKEFEDKVTVLQKSVVAKDKEIARLKLKNDVLSEQCIQFISKVSNINIEVVDWKQKYLDREEECKRLTSVVVDRDKYIKQVDEQCSELVKLNEQFCSQCEQMRKECDETVEELNREIESLKSNQRKRKLREVPILLSPEEESDRLVWRRTNTIDGGKIKCYCGKELVWRLAREHWKNFRDHGRCTLLRTRRESSRVSK